jgi:2',3'-cyclic-nucleotide 2'-phosphodiesterase (5'-nucleotidase family)
MLHPCDKRFVSVISSIASALGLAPRPAQLPSAAAASATPWLDGPPPAPSGADVAHVRIVGFNDFHGQLVDSASKVDDVPIGGAATLSSYIQRERAGNPNGTVVVTAGDNIGAAPPESTLLRHHSTIAVLDAMGLDLTTFGNHEFDDGYAEAIRIIFGDGAYAAARAQQGLPPQQRRRRGAGASVDAKKGAAGVAAAKGKTRWPGSPFPWVAANVVYAKTGRPVLPPYVIKELNGVKVAFVGAVTADLKNVTNAKGIPNIKALDVADSVNRYVPQLQAKGVKTIVVVMHEGGNVDKTDRTKVDGPVKDIAERLHPEVDAIVAGHSHDHFATEIAGKQVIHAGNYAKALGVIDFAVDRRTGQVVSGSSRLVINDENGIAPDPKVAALVDRFAKAVAPRTSKVVTTLHAPLTRAANAAGETTFGTLIADAQRAHAKADVGLMNTGGVRQDIDRTGPLTWGELFSAQPFANRVMKLELTGAQLRQVLEEQFGDGSAPPRMLQVSGLTMHLDITRPVGQRVVKVVMEDGSELDPKRTYSVAANSFIADGGDGYVTLKKGRRRQDLGVDIDALVRHLESGVKVRTQPPGRIVVQAGQLQTDGH